MVFWSFKSCKQKMQKERKYFAGPVFRMISGDITRFAALELCSSEIIHAGIISLFFHRFTSKTTLLPTKSLHIKWSKNDLSLISQRKGSITMHCTDIVNVSNNLCSILPKRLCTSKHGYFWFSLRICRFKKRKRSQKNCFL